MFKTTTYTKYDLYINIIMLNICSHILIQGYARKRISGITFLCWSGYNVSLFTLGSSTYHFIQEYNKWYKNTLSLKDVKPTDEKRAPTCTHDNNVQCEPKLMVK